MTGDGVAEADVLAALADPTRRDLLEALAVHGTASATALSAELPVSRQAVVKHLAVLDRAGLVHSHREGREVRYSVRTAPLNATARWIDALAQRWERRLDAIKNLAEQEEPGGDRHR
ncbi:DNA-binding transcriptional ArsR family regulator [Lipingzhangella halophila]|uniref:DNA-binding transcriptional ArsR family regulator n=1 Tax=Lipingzhangella halophila TaxID=1783352 RepID=A0A7W7RC24_9ACTN|nr:metalloregulator ArsR/SmtB family transcription factor [Lipingzhangella halophila]MBB4929227.1 DNA-binding transcriptional ArsR family regulator [Lipingzhangella halophila]